MFAKSTITIQIVLISLLAIIAQARPTFVPNPAMNPEPFTFDAPAKAENVQVKAQADTPAQARNLGWHGRAAYNPFHPDNLRAAALKGQQDQGGFRPCGVEEEGDQEDFEEEGLCGQNYCCDHHGRC
jgi:hypothetical protein